MGKYEPLPQFLNSRDLARVRLTFADIEAVLGFRLPNSAYEYEAWWSNDSSHSQARTWLAAGWKSEAVDLAGRTVTFARHPVAEPHAPRKADPWGCMAGTVTVFPGTDLTAPSGDDWNAEKGRILNE